MEERINRNDNSAEMDDEYDGEEIREDETDCREDEIGLEESLKNQTMTSIKTQRRLRKRRKKALMLRIRTIMTNPDQRSNSNSFVY